MDTLKVHAPAKVNLALAVTGRRDDGYHLLRMLVQAVDLCDTMVLRDGGPPVSAEPADDIRITCDMPEIPLDSRNSGHKAAVALLRYCGVRRRVGLHIGKRIPVSSGLGGESADAAGVMAGLNRLLDLGLSLDELCSIGAAIGADIPFCLRGGLALVEGVGEHITPLSGLFDDCHILLARPKGNITTAEVYRAFSRLDIPGHFPVPDIEGILGTAGRGDIPPEWFSNSLEAITVGEVPEITGIKELMRDSGALTAVMTGHGPAVAGLFGEKAEGALEAIRKSFPGTWADWSKPIGTGAWVE